MGLLQTSVCPSATAGFITRAASAGDLDLTFRNTRDTMRPYVEVRWGLGTRMNSSPSTLSTTSRRPIGSSLSTPRGGLLAFEEHDDHLWLVKVYLFAAWRNQGIGRSLICQVLDQAKELGKPVRLRVLRVNNRARRLYESLGFRVVSEMPERFVMQAFPRAV
jgi:ribosomal protein S18 acetylase RimI-like enzyme